MNRQAAFSLREQRNQRLLNKMEPTLLANESTNQTMPFWQKTLLFLPVIYAAIYLIGLMYHIGYLSEFELSPYDFQQPADLILVRGGHSLLSSSAVENPMIPLFFLAFSILTIIYYSTLSIRRSKTTSIYTSPKYRRKKHDRMLLELAEEKIKKTSDRINKLSPIIDQLIILIVSTFCIVFLLALSLQSGITDAQRQKKKLYLPDSTNIKIVSSLLNDGPFLRVACNTSHCAYWNNAGTLILRHDQVEQTFLPSKEAKKS
ncbi:hypothetical protein [Aeromonas caviae]|uniref:hypothetical protein n=1 Tax=Aeromonas caviae TaxID=648 RepID=UPI00111AEAD0|nr:hypothetical protein [Aeromonas caviae]